MSKFIIAKHYKDVDLKAWKKRWPNFLPQEFDSDDFSLKLYIPALDGLQRVRTRLGRPLRITSAYRSPKHNRRVGGKKNSQHALGKAFDIALPRKSDGPLIEKLARSEGFTGIGRYPKRHFIHIDMRPPKPSGAIYQWGSWK